MQSLAAALDPISKNLIADSELPNLFDHCDTAVMDCFDADSKFVVVMIKNGLSVWFDLITPLRILTSEQKASFVKSRTDWVRLAQKREHIFPSLFSFFHARVFFIPSDIGPRCCDCLTLLSRRMSTHWRLKLLRFRRPSLKVWILFVLFCSWPFFFF